MTLPVSQAHLLKRQPDTPLGRLDALLVCLFLDQGLRCGEVHALRDRATLVAYNAGFCTEESMMSTNGSKAKPGPDREQIIREATYYAALFGWYDTSEAAQRVNLLTVTVMDMADIPGEARPSGATHQLYVCINATAYIVTRYSGPPPLLATYKVEHSDRTDQQRHETALRATALDAALWHFTGGSYRPAGDDHEARRRAVDELLEDGKEYETEERAEWERHAIVRDELPDIYLAGVEGGPAPRVSRQWSVAIGPYHSCEVGLVGYDENGNPDFIAVDREPGEGEE
jgi:hypothetical protein